MNFKTLDACVSLWFICVSGFDVRGWNRRFIWTTPQLCHSSAKKSCLSSNYKAKHTNTNPPMLRGMLAPTISYRTAISYLFKTHSSRTMSGSEAFQVLWNSWKEVQLLRMGLSLFCLRLFLFVLAIQSRKKEKKMCKGIFLYDQIASYFDLTFDSTVVCPLFFFVRWIIFTRFWIVKSSNLGFCCWIQSSVKSEGTVKRGVSCVGGLVLLCISRKIIK